MITLDEFGDPTITGNVQVPIPTVLGILELVRMKLGSQYFGGVLREKQESSIMKPQIVVPNLHIKRPS